MLRTGWQRYTGKSRWSQVPATNFNCRATKAGSSWSGFFGVWTTKRENARNLAAELDLELTILRHQADDLDQAADQIRWSRNFGTVCCANCFS
jgi:hypothetical protein